MKITVQPVLGKIELSEYAPALAGQAVYVWLNPSRAFLRKRAEAVDVLNQPMPPEPPEIDPAETTGYEIWRAEQFRFKADAFNRVMMTWHAELWSKHADEATHWTADELTALDEQDPAFLMWLIRRSNQLMSEHRAAEKKS